MVHEMYKHNAVSNTLDVITKGKISIHACPSVPMPKRNTEEQQSFPTRASSTTSSTRPAGKFEYLEILEWLTVVNLYVHVIIVPIRCLLIT